MTSRPGRNQQPWNTARKTNSAYSVIILYFILESFPEIKDKRHGCDRTSIKMEKSSHEMEMQFLKWLCMVCRIFTLMPNKSFIHLDTLQGYPRDSWHELVVCGTNNFNFQLHVHEVNVAIKDLGHSGTSITERVAVLRRFLNI